MKWITKAIRNRSRLINLELDLQNDYETEWRQNYKNLSNKKPYRDLNHYKKIRKINLFENESRGPGRRIQSWGDLAKKRKAESDRELARDLRHAAQLQDREGVDDVRFADPEEQVAQDIEDEISRVAQQETLDRLEREERERLEQIGRANAMADVLVADMLRRTEGVRGRGKHRQHTHRKNTRGTRRGNTHRKKRKHKKSRGKKKN